MIIKPFDWANKHYQRETLSSIIQVHGTNGGWYENWELHLTMTDDVLSLGDIKMETSKAIVCSFMLHMSCQSKLWNSEVTGGGSTVTVCSKSLKVALHMLHGAECKSVVHCSRHNTLRQVISDLPSQVFPFLIRGHHVVVRYKWLLWFLEWRI